MYAWGIIAVFVFFMNLFYARLIVPLFNKQTPLCDGSLKTKIQDYAQKVGFQLDKIVVIDGSKRSTKANAYFSGFGSEKRVTLFDTLINDLEEEEIVAVLAHEVGHYKRKHILFNLIISTLIMGFTFLVIIVIHRKSNIIRSLKCSFTFLSYWFNSLWNTLQSHFGAYGIGYEFYFEEI